MRLFDRRIVRIAMVMSCAIATQPALAQGPSVRLMIPDTLESGSLVVGQVDFGPGFSHVRRDYVIDWGGDEGLRSVWSSDFAPNPFPAYFDPGRHRQTKKSEYVALGRPGRRRVILTVHDEYGRTIADTVNVTLVERTLSLGMFWVANGSVKLLFPSLSSEAWRLEEGSARDTLRLAVAPRDSTEYDALRNATYRLGRTRAICCGASTDSLRLLETDDEPLPSVVVYFAWSDLLRNTDLPIGSRSIVVTGSMPMNGVPARFRATMPIHIVARRMAARPRAANR
jgi:hypothetical protein